MSRLEIREYLEEVYKLEVKQVTVFNNDGKFYNKLDGKKFQGSSFKIAIVELFERSMTEEQWEAEKQKTNS